MSKQRRQKHVTDVAGDAGVSPRISRRAFVGGALGATALVVTGSLLWQRRTVGAHFGTVTVFKSPTCECCGRWADHMRDRGFTLDVRELADTVTVKRNLGVPESLYSCHTSDVAGYVFEGHVPADLVAHVLRERPALRGLAVPGMPQSAPGMDIGRQRYEVIAFTATGETSVYAVRSS